MLVISIKELIMNIFRFSIIIFLLFACLSQHGNLLAQDSTPCGVTDPDVGAALSEPWYNDPTYFARMIDSLSILGAGGFGAVDRDECSDTRVVIPIKFWWYRENSTDIGIPALEEFQAIVDRLNTFYVPLAISFVLKCPEEVIDPVRVDVNFFGANVNPGPIDPFAININIVRTLRAGGVNPGGVWIPIQDLVYVNRNAFLNTNTTRALDITPPLLAHELGHYFGLLWHTHAFFGSPCRREPVNRDIYPLYPSPQAFEETLI